MFEGRRTIYRVERPVANHLPVAGQLAVRAVVHSASSSGDVAAAGCCTLVVVGAVVGPSLALNCRPVLVEVAAELMHRIGRSSANAVEIGMPCCDECCCMLRNHEMQVPRWWLVVAMPS